MSAPTSHDPLVVNTKDGVTWLRRAVTSDGHGLYAVTDSCACPPYLMATLAELAEHGISGSADVLPVPVGPEPQPMSDERFAEIRNRKLNEVTSGPWLVADGADGKPVVYVEEPLNGIVGARVLLAAEGASEADVQFVASARRSVPELLVDNERLRARVSELESERHVTNEALDDAVQALRTDRDRITALAERLRAGQQWQRGRNPELVSENFVSQSELRSIFGIPLAPPWADGIARRIVPVQSLREDAAPGVPCSKCGDPVDWVTSTNSDGGFWRHRIIPGRVLDHFGMVAGVEGRHGFEREYQGESDAKRRLARCKHCGHDHGAPMHVEAGGE